MLIQGVTLTNVYVVDVGIITANLSMNLDAATYTSGVTWTDSSGNGKNANIAGAVTTYTLSTGFNVIRFNGSAFANAYLGFGTTLNTWLDLHPEITHWAAVDDLYMGTWLDNFAWAKRVDLGIKDLAVQEQILGSLCQ